MKTQSYKKGLAFVLTLAMVFTTLFGGFGFLGISGVVGEAYADPGPITRTTTLDLNGMGTTNSAIEGWAWNSATRVLTLSGINLSTTSEQGIKVPASTTIVLEGDNQIKSTCAPSDAGSSGIYSLSGYLTIIGGNSDTLTVTAGTSTISNSSCGIYITAGDLTIDGNVTATGGSGGAGSTGIYLPAANGTLTITGGTVRALGEQGAFSNVGIFCSHDVAISGSNTRVESSGSFAGLYSGDNLTISNGAHVTAAGIDANINSSYGFKVPRNFTISDSGTAVTAIGGDVTTGGISYGINSDTAGVFTMNGGTLNATGGDAPNGTSYGIYRNGSIVFNGGTTTAIAGTATTGTAIIATGTITFGSGPATAVTSPVGGGLSSNGKFIATVSGGAVAATSATIEPPKAITAFNFNGLTPNVTGTVNETDKTIALTVPYGTNVTALVPTITHSGVSITSNSGIAKDFTNPVTYTVTAADSSTQVYTVTVTVASNGGGNGSGGSGGSGGTPATPVINTNTGSVTGNQLKNAADAAKEGGTVTVKSDKTSEVTLPNSGLDSLSGKNNSLTVVTENGTLTFDSKAVGAIGTQATATDIKVIVDDVVKTTLTEEQQTKVGDKTVYDLSVMSGGKLISSFNGGKVKVSIPYELKTGETAENLTVWYMADNGSLTEINCTYDAKNKAVTFVVDHFSKYIIGYDELAGWVNPFADVKSSAWYYDAAAFVNVNGLMKGQTDTTFGPQGAMTRGMFVTILGRMEGIDTALYASENTFSDVKSNQYYAPYIAWATDKGIVSGMGGDKFAPNAAVTREQMAVMMMNYMKFKGQGPTGEWAIQLTYNDLDQVSSWADEAVMFMTMKDLMNGMGNDAKGNPLFAPKSTSTRAQTAQVMMSLGELVK